MEEKVLNKLGKILEEKISQKDLIYLKRMVANPYPLKKKVSKITQGKISKIYKITISMS